MVATRREILIGGAAAMLSPFLRGDPRKSLLGGEGCENLSDEPILSYIEGFTNLIEAWSPVGSGAQTISLASPIVPLADFTIDGCMTYKGIFSGDSAILGLNGGSSGNFSLWFRDSNVRPRCFASEGAAIITDLSSYPTFAFSIRFDSVNLTMQFASGDLVNTHTFSTANWTWNTAYGTISSGLSSFGMDGNRLSAIHSIRVYPFLLTDEELLENNATDQARFF